ncbi:DUF5694 domain-containing protein [Robertkochia aurantiaca]|uniref:DUF5694 domain-containing protein n=1 Tax=Robertkochia aurantiaca TaxID=2873700 RepID=UPI001CCF20DF|nr:DUF5694 domain-containing protein [Robertkochia sp. 3YJGBD-33]
MFINALRVFILLLPGFLLSQKSEQLYDNAFDSLKSEQAELLILGTFHFKDAGLDSYKPQFDIDIFSEQRQKELNEVLQDLSAWAPTKIAVEIDASRQPYLDSLYQAYLNGNFELKANEIFQIAFRLGKIMGHDKLYAVDAGARGYEKESDPDYAKKKIAAFRAEASPEQITYETRLDSAFYDLYALEDKWKATTDLKTIFRYKNSEKRLSIGHGHYLTGYFKMGGEQDYFGPDAGIWWYNRNLRIFHNLLKLKEPGDRVFLLIGSGHVPIIDFLAEASFDYVKNTVDQVLK